MKLQFFPFYFLIIFSFKTNGQDIKSSGQDIPSLDSRISFPSFDIIIYNFKVYNTTFEFVDNPVLFGCDTSEMQLEMVEVGSEVAVIKAKKDTLHLRGLPDEYIDNKLIKILPKNKNDSIAISFSLEEAIIETYNYKKKYDDEWYKNQVLWKERTNYKSLKDSSKYFFRVKSIDPNIYEKERKKKFQLKDTLADFSGESTSIATLIYKNKLCHYSVGYSYFRIQRFRNNKLAETRYVYITEISGD